MCDAGLHPVEHAISGSGTNWKRVWDPSCVLRAFLTEEKIWRRRGDDKDNVDVGVTM
jgi:hypothetical protein